MNSWGEEMHPAWRCLEVHSCSPWHGCSAKHCINQMHIQRDTIWKGEGRRAPHSVWPCQPQGLQHDVHARYATSLPRCFSMSSLADGKALLRAIPGIIAFAALWAGGSIQVWWRGRDRFRALKPADWTPAKWLNCLGGCSADPSSCRKMH